MATKRELLEAVLGDRKLMRTVIQEVIKQIKEDETKTYNKRITKHIEGSNQAYRKLGKEERTP